MKTIYLICNQSTEPFIFEPQDNEVSKYRQKELKELFEKEASGIEEIYSNKNVEMYKTISEVFESALEILSDPILLSPSGAQCQLVINSLLDIVEWNKLRSEVYSVSSHTIIKNNCVYVFQTEEDYSMAIAKWNNKKL